MGKQTAQAKEVYWEANGSSAEEQKNITMEEALDKARAWEAAGRQASNMTATEVLSQ